MGQGRAKLHPAKTVSKRLILSLIETKQNIQVDSLQVLYKKWKANAFSYKH